MSDLASWFRQQLSREGHVRKFLVNTLGEILLIMVGILLALQIDNWNATRQELATEQRILQILQHEYQYNLEELDRNKAKSDIILHSADTLLQLFGTGETPGDAERAERMLKRLTAYPTYDPSNGALNDLINSGKLELIRSDSLRMHLSRWYGVMQDIKEDEGRLMDMGDRYLEPYRVRYITYSDHSKFHASMDKAFQDKELENVIFLMRSRTNYIREVNFPMVRKEIHHILRHIENQMTESR